jgi:hypothetical protein
MSLAESVSLRSTQLRSLFDFMHAAFAGLFVFDGVHFDIALWVAPCPMDFVE